MRKIKLFLSLLMAVLSVGNVWAETASITFSELGLENGVQYTDPFSFDDSNITVTFAGGDNDGKYYNTGTGVRTYGGGSFTIATASGKITAATFTFSGSSYAPSDNVANVGTYSNGSWSGDASSFTLTRPSGTGHWRLQSISVTYTPDGGGEPGGGGQGGGSGTEGDGTINFGSAQGSTNVNSASVSGDDDLGNTWDVTTTGTTSFTPNPSYAQIGSSSKPATSITFTTTLSQEMKVSAFSAKFGGFSGTEGIVTLKVGNTAVGTGSLSGSTDVTVEADDEEATGTTLTVTVTGIAKGVKAYFISYTLEEPSTPDPGKQDLPVDDFKWSADSYTATIGASNTFPTLTNAQNVDFSYQSSSDAVAEIATDGTITLKKAGTTTIKAVFDGNDTYNAKTVSYALTVKDAPLATMDAIFAKATAVSSTATDVDITFNNWVVSGVKNSNAYVTDGTKGFIIYASSHGFVVGNTLSGTASCKVQLYRGSAELTNLTSSTTGLIVGTGETAPVNELDADGISALSGVNTGSLIKVSGEATSGSVIAGVTLYNTLYTGGTMPTLESGKNYNCTGMYLQYNETKELLPRTSADIEEIIPAGAPEFDPASKKFVGSISVALSQENDLPIYYTDNASIKDNPSTSTWTPYENAIPVNATKTIYAAAKGDEWSDIVYATYTLAEPLTTMAEVQSATTSTTDVTIDVTINNWVVTAVSGSQVWIADADNTKGILLYKSGNEFAAGKKLNGTVFDTKIKIFNGYAELTSLVAGDVEVTDADEITPRTTTIADLANGHPAEQGTIVKLENLTYNGSVFSDGTNTITIDTRFFEPSLTSGKKYDLSGVVYYGSTVATIKIMPRATTDVVELASHDLTSITLGGTYPTTFETGDAFSHEGMVVTAHYDGADEATVTTSAEFSGYDMSVADTYEVTVSYTEGEITKTAKYNITVSDPAPTGDFEELDGELVAGDYLIYEGGSLMLAQIENSRFYYAEQEPDANGIISNPSQYAVWTLAKSGDYWTFYNAKAGKFAAGTGAKNKAQLLDDGTDNKSLWTIDGNLVVTNKANAAAEVNATLRHNYDANTNYGFACYSADQGGKPVFYKRATPSYYISEALTGCTADANNPTKVPQALTEDVVLKYNLTAGYVWPNEITVTVGGVELDANELDYLWDTDKAPAELTIAKEKVNGNIAITITAIEKSLDNITIAYAPTKVAYETGEFFNPAGLQIQLNYTAGASDVVVYSNETKDAFTFSPDLETALAPANTEVTITYGGKFVNQAITVTDPVAVEKTVVIIAEYDSKLYAMSNAVSGSVCAAIEVTKDGDDLVVTSEDNKAAVQWFMSKLGANVKLQVANNEGKYLSSASNDGNLSLSNAEVNWTLTEDVNNYLFSIGDTRALLYRNTGVFKHYAKSNLINNPNDYFAVSELFEVADGATNIKVVEPIVYEFVVDPDEDVAFGTVELNEPVAAKSFDVTLTNIANATVELSDNTAFEINVTALTEEGTITITPKTSVAGNFSATITLHDEAGNAEDKVINVTMKVAAPKDCDRTDDFNTVDANNSYLDRESDEGWNAVNTAVVEKDEVTYWMINGKTSAVGVITSPEFNYGIKELSFDYYYSYNESHGISFKVEIKQNGSVIKTETITKDDAVKNTIYTATIENIDLEGKYQIVFTNLCPSNSTSNADRYAIGNLCWKKYGEPVYEELRAGLTAGNYYTVCYNKKMTAVKGASLWEFAGKDASFAYIKPATAPYAAGKPYIVYAESAKLEAVLEGDAVDASEIVPNGALHGTFEKMFQADLDAAGDNIYLIIGNELRRVDGQNGNTLPAYRAYIDVDEIGSAPANMPAHVRSMPLHKDTATGMDELNASETPVKVMINGQLFIIRGEKIYDATGRLVK